jgi:hypothetical protein
MPFDTETDNHPFWNPNDRASLLSAEGLERYVSRLSDEDQALARSNPAVLARFDELLRDALAAQTPTGVCWSGVSRNRPILPSVLFARAKAAQGRRAA